jgi:F-type H+-transporting ATPase subunit alpha
VKSSSEKENQAFIDLLKSKLDSTKKNQYDKGVVIYASDGIAAIAFLPQAKMSNVITFSSGETGIIMNLERDFVLASILGDSSSVKEGDFVTIKSDTFKIKTGLNLLGRVLNGLGDPIDGLGEIVGVESEVEKMAPGVMTRKSVHEPIQTGILAIDALIPIGRELRIGDRKTGKTSIAIDAIINQAIINKDKDDNEKVYSVYVAIGQKLSSLARIVETLKKYDAMKYTVVISSTSSDSAAMQYFAPYVGCSIAEFFRDNTIYQSTQSPIVKCHFC